MIKIFTFVATLTLATSSIPGFIVDCFADGANDDEVKLPYVAHYDSDVADVFTSIEEALKTANADAYRRHWHEQGFWFDYTNGGISGVNAFRDWRSHRAKVRHKGKPIQAGYYLVPQLNRMGYGYIDKVIIVSCLIKFLPTWDEQWWLGVNGEGYTPHSVTSDEEKSNILDNIYVVLVKEGGHWLLLGMSEDLRSVKALASRYVGHQALYHPKIGMPYESKKDTYKNKISDEEIKARLQTLWKGIDSLLEPDARVIFKQTRLILETDKPGITPHSFLDEGRMTVRFPVEFGRLLYCMGDAAVSLLMIDEHNFQGAMYGYVQYAARKLRRRNTATGEDQPIPVLSPSEWLDIPKDIADVMRSPELIARRLQVLDSAATFVLAHEVLHHILGHTNGTRQKPPQEWNDLLDQQSPELKERLMMMWQEMEADGLGVQLVMRSDVDPIAVPISLMYFWAVHCTSREEMEGATHIADILRSIFLFNAFLDDGYQWAGKSLLRTIVSKPPQTFGLEQINQLRQLRSGLHFAVQTGRDICLLQ
jgi:hypothetical protein